MKLNETSESWSHPHKNMSLQYTKTPFKCDGCKEIGIGSHYKWSTSSSHFDLHTHCAMPSESLVHPFYPECSFQFLTQPPGQTARYCNACEKVVVGYVYHCVSCGFDLHPCCAKLPMVLDDGQITLSLCSKLTAPCHRCGRKGRSWSYISSYNKYNLHVACVKSLLVDSCLSDQITMHPMNMISNSRGNYTTTHYSSAYKRTSKAAAGKSTTDTPTNLSLNSALQLTRHRHNKETKSGKAQKCCEVAGLALQFVVSALLGDPTTLVAGLVATLLSK